MGFSRELLLSDDLLKCSAHSNSDSLAMGFGLIPLAFIGSLVEPALTVESISYTATFRRHRQLLA